MHFTLWPSVRANEGGYGEISWAEFVGFVAFPVVAEVRETLEGWSPAKFTGTRNKAHVESVSLLTLDDDKSGLSTDGVVALWGEFAGVVHTSFRHTPEAPRHRIALRLSRDVTAAEYERLWAHVHALATGRGQVLDEMPKDPSRFWFVPAHREGAPYDWRELPGAPLDVDAILAEPLTAPSVSLERRQVESSKVVAEYTERGRAPADSRRAAMAAALGAAWPARGRHEAQLALAGALRVDGFDEAEAVDFLCAVCREAGDEDRAKREATVAHTYAQEGPLTGWLRLKSLVDPVTVDLVRKGLGKFADSHELAHRLAEAAAAPPAPPAPVVEGNTVAFGALVAQTAAGLDAELPPIDFQVGELIARGDVVMFVAHGNSLKTWLAFSLVQAIASGRPWLGKYFTKRGRALIVDFESGKYEVARRLKLLGVREADVGDRLFRASYPAAQFTDPETWIGLAGHGLNFIVIDSFAASTRGIDENDKTAADMLQLAGTFAESTCCTVLVIHHSRKGQGGDRRESVRGSTAIYAACDRIYEFDDLEKHDGGRVLTTMRSTKDGAGQSPAPVRVELSDQGLRWVELPKEVESKDPNETNRKLVIETLSSAPRGVPKVDLVNVMKGRREAKFELLSKLALNGIVVEYKAEKTAWIMLRPGVELI